MDDLIEGRRMKGSSLKLDVIQKAHEFVQNERMSQGGRVKKNKIKQESTRAVY